MLNIVLRSLYSFFLIYGIWSFFRNIVRYMCTSSFERCDEFAVVIKTRNSEETLEATVRSLICRILKDTKQCCVPDIIIVDFGSDDSTCEIAKKLSEDYSFVYFTTYELYNKTKGQKTEK